MLSRGVAACSSRTRQTLRLARGKVGGGRRERERGEGEGGRERGGRRERERGGGGGIFRQMIQTEMQLISNKHTHKAQLLNTAGKQMSNTYHQREEKDTYMS